MESGIINSDNVFLCTRPYITKGAVGMDYQEFKILQTSMVKRICFVIYKDGIQSLHRVAVSILATRGITLKSGYKTYICIDKKLLNQGVLK